MARRKKTGEEPTQAAAPGLSNIRTTLKYAALASALIAGVVLITWLTLSGEHFLINDARFRLTEQTASADGDAISVAGIQNTTLKAVLEVFEQDRGRSLFLLNPEERKLRLEQLPWVRTATVRRIWPNRLAVEIEERVPVAFIEVPAGASGNMENPIAYRPMLVDADGMVLGMKSQAALALPLLKGVHLDDQPSVRKERVRTMLRLLRELSAYQDRIPEINLSRHPSVSIAFEAAGVTVELILGEDSWLKRVDYFSRNVESIREVLKDRVVLDLTMDERVILKAAPEAPGLKGGAEK